MVSFDPPAGLEPVLAEAGPAASQAPLLSICIPTYNRATPLRRTLQQFAKVVRALPDAMSVEIVISNNASTDETTAVLEESLQALAQACPVRAYTQAGNLGAEGNFKFLYEQARGEYVWLWGDDDMLHEEQLGLLVDDLRMHRPEVCISSFSNYGTSGDQTEVGAGSDTSVVTDLRTAIERIYALGKISQYVCRRRTLTGDEQALSDETARVTSFWFVALAVMLLVRYDARLLLRRANIGWSDRGSWDMRFSPRVYATKRAALLMALGEHPLRAHFEQTVPHAPVDVYVVGNLFRTTLGVSRMDPSVARQEYRYVRENLRALPIGNWRVGLKLPVVLALFPVRDWWWRRSGR